MPSSLWPPRAGTSHPPSPPPDPVALSLRRHFCWYDNELSAPATGLAAPTLFCIAENDEIIPSALVREDIGKLMPSADVCWWAAAGHTMWMFSAECHRDVVEWVER